jgi:cytochrome P450
MLIINCRSQVTSSSTLMLAGHETTASTLTWAFYELSKHPEYQKKIREEIKSARAQASQRGDDELSIADLDSMKYLLAAMKVRPLCPFYSFVH